MALSYVFPVYDLPEPTGSYPVGTSSSVLTDTRMELYSDNSSEKRSIKLQFWYPAETTEGYENVPWLEDGIVVARGLARDTGLPSFVLDHTITIASNSYKDAPISTAQSSYPVIIISHGWRGFRNLHTDFAEDLASQGYIVVSIDHTYGSVAVDLNGDVKFVNYDALPNRDVTDDFLDYANTLVYTYAGDIISTIDHLEAEYDINATRDYIAKMDLTKIGLIGHSTGGGAGVAAALEDDRIDAVFGLDSWVESIDPTIIDTGLSIPSVFIRSGQWEVGYNNERLYQLINQSSPSNLYQIDGTTHYDFTMVYMYSPLTKQIGFTGDVDGRYLNTILKDMIREFFTDTLINTDYEALTINQWEEVRSISTD
jgi:pimeloyl-ACP methyl ester carboxylesterase